MLQLHPESGDPMFHHRTADSKFNPHAKPGDNLGPISHVSSSLTQDQASIMIWGIPGESIYHSSGNPALWGLRESDSRIFACMSGPNRSRSDYDGRIFMREGKGTIKTIELQDEVFDKNQKWRWKRRLLQPTEVTSKTKSKNATQGVSPQEHPKHSDTCQCTPLALHKADLRCLGRSREQQEMEPFPITVVEVPRNSYITRVSAAEALAYRLIPFQEQ